MKTFAVSLLIFVLLLALIIWNFCFINQTADELEMRLHTVTANTNEAEWETLASFWEEKREFVSFSVPMETVVALNERIAELQCALKAKDEDEIAKSRALALCAVTELRRLERFSIGSIL